MAATDDAELARLLDNLVAAVRRWVKFADWPHYEATVAARAALLAYLDRAYLRLPPPLDGEPVELEDVI